jgi:hypothetical protein
VSGWVVVVALLTVLVGGTEGGVVGRRWWLMVDARLSPSADIHVTYISSPSVHVTHAPISKLNLNF